MRNEKDNVSKSRMDADKGKGSSEGTNKAQPTGGKTPPPDTGPVTRLFGKWDWIAFLITTLVTFAAYFYTLSPDVTLEDSGELAVASYYAGVPHPPGYPVWTIYTWLFTVLFPFSNIAWRVALSSAVAAALSCGLLALLVSRGSVMMLEGIAEFKNLEEKWRRWICLAAGFVSGALMGFNGFMWSQAVIVEVYTLSVLSFMGVLCCMLRWAYAPHQRRYLYWGWFLFGICFTNHQTLIVAAMGIEFLVLAASPKLGRDLFTGNTIIYVIGLLAKAKGATAALDNTALLIIFNLVGIGSAAIAAWVSLKTESLPFVDEWKSWPLIVAAWLVGALFYFYMPIASMTNPPLNWGYPRTEEGFWHALLRGQYDRTSPGLSPGQVLMYISGAIDEFNFVNLMIGLLPFFFFSKMARRERGWFIGLTIIWFCLAILLLALLNPGTDRQAREQARVFFAASHLIVAIAIGYGLTLIAALIATRYESIRKYLLWSAAAATALAIYARVDMETQFPLDKFTAGFVLALALAALVTVLVHRQKAPLSIFLAIFCLLPIESVLAHWADNEQRGHLFGYWFGHDMFTPPYGLYPEMEKNAILFGGTDPGRFNPTYMIFCESFTPPSKKRDPKFDRRDVYLITQNALADGTYLDYIRAHYNRSAQQDPPFFVNFFRRTKEEELGRTNLIAKMLVPLDRYFTKLGARIEKRRRAEGVYPPLENPPPPPPAMVNNPYDVGAYLSREILTPSVPDSQVAFQEYIADAQRRLQHDMANPQAPKQIKPGEDVRVVDNRISVSGQVAVMAINGLLTKVIFDKNPKHEFYVEESFPLDWMFPYLTPYGIIMKINRNPVPEMTQEMVEKDHKFWSEYSERLIGKWITYDTSIKQICDFAEKTYIRRDLAGFTGAPEFVRDKVGQKAFSKLRSAIGGVYQWRIANSRTPEETQRMYKEAEFAFKQSFAYCPYSPEAVYKLVTLLVNQGRIEEAALIAETSLKFDPESGAMQALSANIQQIRQGQAANITAQTQVTMAEQRFRDNPTNLQVAFELASMYLQLGKTNEAVQVLQSLLLHTNVNAQTVLSVANAYTQIGHIKGLEDALIKLTQIMPEHPESWYDLARAQAALNKVPSALQSLTKAVELSDERLKKDANSKDLGADALTNQSFAAFRSLPEFMRVISRSGR